MPVETLGEALDLSWTVHMRCLHDGREGLKHRRDCTFRRQLDLENLVCTRGRDFPLGRLAERLRCPRCGCQRVVVMFGPPGGMGMQLVEDNEFQILCVSDDGPVESILSCHQKFKHHKICKENIRFGAANTLSFLHTFLASVPSKRRPQPIG